MAKDESQRFSGFTLASPYRQLAGLTGFGLLVFGIVFAIIEGSNLVSLLTIGIGASLLLAFLVGAVGRLTISVGESKISIDPPEQHPQPEATEEADRTSKPEPPDPEPEVPASNESGIALMTKAFRAWDADDYDEFESLMQQAIKAEEVRNPNLALSLSSMRLSKLYGLGRTEKLEELIRLRDQHPESSHPTSWLARAYETSGQLEKAAEILQGGYDNDRFPGSARRDILRHLIRVLRKSDHFSEAEAILIQAAETAEGNEAAAAIQKELALVYRDTEQKQLEYHALERVLDLEPGDVSTRFDLAYDYSEHDLELLALHHYRIIEEQRASPAEVNNIAVILKDLDLPITEVNYYLRAAAKGHTLAAANLARTAARSGLVKEANEYLSRARDQEDIHKAVHDAASWISESTSDEKERFPRVEKAAKLEHDLWLKRLEIEGSEEDCAGREVDGIWETNLGPITFREDDGRFAASFETETWQTWNLIGDLEGCVYTFDWIHNRTWESHAGTGYIVYRDDGTFFGIIRHTPMKGEAQLIEGSNRKPPSRVKSPAAVAFGDLIRATSKESSKDS